MSSYSFGNTPDINLSSTTYDLSRKQKILATNTIIHGWHNVTKNSLSDVSCSGGTLITKQQFNLRFWAEPSSEKHSMYFFSTLLGSPISISPMNSSSKLLRSCCSIQNSQKFYLGVEKSFVGKLNEEFSRTSFKGTETRS